MSKHTDTFGEVCPANWKPGERTMKADVKESKEYFQGNVIKTTALVVSYH